MPNGRNSLAESDRKGARVSGAASGSAGGTSIRRCELAGDKAGCWATEAAEAFAIFVAKSCRVFNISAEGEMSAETKTTESVWCEGPEASCRRTPEQLRAIKWES